MGSDHSDGTRDWELMREGRERVDRLARAVLEQSSAELRNLDQIGFAVGVFDAFQQEARHLGVDLPKLFNDRWWELEIIYATSLNVGEVQSAEMLREAAELVTQLRSTVRGVLDSKGSQGLVGPIQRLLRLVRDSDPSRSEVISALAESEEYDLAIEELFEALSGLQLELEAGDRADFETLKSERDS